jgi:hypothetical protein
MLRPRMVRNSGPYELRWQEIPNLAPNRRSMVAPETMIWLQSFGAGRLLGNSYERSTIGPR